MPASRHGEGARQRFGAWGTECRTRSYVVDPASVLGPVMMSETALPGLAILSQRPTALQRRLPAPGRSVSAGVPTLPRGMFRRAVSEGVFRPPPPGGFEPAADAVGRAVARSILRGLPAQGSWIAPIRRARCRSRTGSRRLRHRPHSAGSRPSRCPKRL